jgi:hypothetical protein
MSLEYPTINFTTPDRSSFPKFPLVEQNYFFKEETVVSSTIHSWLIFEVWPSTFNFSLFTVLTYF